MKESEASRDLVASVNATMTEKSYGPGIGRLGKWEDRVTNDRTPIYYPRNRHADSHRQFSCSGAPAHVTTRFGGGVTDNITLGWQYRRRENPKRPGCVTRGWRGFAGTGHLRGPQAHNSTTRQPVAA